MHLDFDALEMRKGLLCECNVLLLLDELCCGLDRAYPRQ